MFKRILSLLLCIIMFASCFSCITVEAAAAYDARSLFSVTSAPVKDNLLRYTINITSQQKGIAGIVLNVNYDSTVLKPVSCEPAKTTSPNVGTKDNFEGTYVHGVTENNPDVYSIAYMNTVAVSTNAAAKAFFNVVFEVIDPRRPQTDISFYCKEYYSVSESDKNISVEDGLQEIAVYQNVPTLEAPVLTSLEYTLEGFMLRWNPVPDALGYAIYRSSPSSSKTRIGTTTGNTNTVYEDKGLKSGESYTYTVTAVGTYESGFDTVGLTKMFISKPTIEYIKNVAGGVEIRWTKTAGAEWYNIMRRVKGEDKFEKIAIRVASIDTVYKDNTVTDGVEYEYDINSATDTFESETAQYGVSGIYIKAPVINSVANVLGGIQIKWKAHEKATSYVVYRKAIGVDTEFKEYASVNTSSFVDTAVEAGKAYTYSVKVCTNNGDSAYDTTGYTITCVPSTVVTGFEVNRASITVSWAQISGVEGYYIYRKPTTSSAWLKVGTVAKDILSYEDKSVDSGVQYVYAVTPIISNSESTKIESDPIYFIGAPQDVAASNEENGISLKWNAVGGAVTYNIYRREDNGTLLLIDVCDSNSYLDLGVSYDKTYTYCVEAISPKGISKVSFDSNSLIRIGAIGKTTASIAEGGIKIEWEASDIAESYALYRFNGTQWILLTQTSETYYIDSNVVSDESYAYAVAAIRDTSIGVLNTDTPQYLRYLAPVSGITTANGNGYTRISWEAVAGAQSYYLYKSAAADGEYELIATLRGGTLTFKDEDVKSAREAFYKVQCHNGENYSVMSSARQNLYLSRVSVTSIKNGYSGQTVTWKAVAGAKSYNIYRKVYGGEYELYDSVSSKKTSFLDENPVNGRRMYYAVRAVNGNSTSSYKAKSEVYVAAPKVTVTNSSSSITVKWGKNNEATSYTVYRKVNSAKSWTKLDNVEGTSFTDKNVKAGNTYKYTVRAYKKQYSSGYNTDGWKIVRLTAPKLKAVENGYGYLKISWGKVSGAKQYNVYRKADGDKSWKKIAETKNTYYNDKKVENKEVYKYTVKAVNGKSISTYNGSGKSGRYLQAPKLSVQNATNGIYMTWSRISGANSYYLYRKAGNAKSWKKIDTITGNSYLDTNVKEGVVYKYTIRAYGSKTLSGYNNDGWGTMHLKTPELKSIKVHGSGIKLTWGKVSYATSYYVYRKERGDKTWTKIATTKSTSYVDKKVEYDETYTYTVRAVKGNYKSFYKSTGLSCRYR